MQIIGEAGTRYDKRVIVRMSLGEFEKLTGQNCQHNYDGGIVPSAGSTFNIRKAWDAVNSIKSAEERVVRFAKELRGIADDAEALCRKLPVLTGVEEEKGES